jgi:hypothetical protein
MNRLIRCLPWLLLFLAHGVLAETAARIEFAVGGVTAQAASGVVRTLARGDLVESGETVNTNEGRAQLRFTDGGFVSLYGGSVFRIDDYRWAGVNDGSERSFFSLLKGALRTVTGRVAKVNKKAYLMSTVVATIGVRGTEYTMQLQDMSLAGAVAEGEIEVCNAGGCLAVPAGQAYFVAGPDVKPAISANQTFLPPSAPDALAAGVVSSTTDSLTAVVDGVGGLLGTTNDALFDTLQGTTGTLVGATQDLSGALLGGGALGQTAQGVTGAAGGAVGGAAGAAGGATGGLIGGATGALGGIVGGSGSTLLNLGF